MNKETNDRESIERLISSLPSCKHCGATPTLFRKPGAAGKYYALECPTIDCVGHETLSGDTFPWDTIQQAADEWIGANMKPCLRCGGAVRIIKSPPQAASGQTQKFIHCDGCAWSFSPAFIQPDGDLAKAWNDR